MSSSNQEPFDQDADAVAPAQPVAADLSVAEQTAKDESEYPDLTPGQVKTLRAGKLPGEMKLHAITLMLSLIALVIAIAAFAR